MYVFSPGALGALVSLGRLYLAVTELLLPTQVCIYPWYSLQNDDQMMTSFVALKGGRIDRTKVQG